MQWCVAHHPLVVVPDSLLDHVEATAQSVGVPLDRYRDHDLSTQAAQRLATAFSEATIVAATEARERAAMRLKLRDRPAWAQPVLDAEVATDARRALLADLARLCATAVREAAPLRALARG